jgi:hypothetical protein
MPSLTLKLNGDGAWPDLRVKPFVHLRDDGPAIEIAVLNSGMSSGRPSVAIRLDLPDGTTVLAQTSARLFCSAGRAIAARYPALFED